MPRPKPTGALNPPLRDIRRITEVLGPRGGTIFVTEFECGHRLWNRLPPKNRPEAPCMGCWVDNAVEAQDCIDEEHAA